MADLPITELDFDKVKEELKTFLKKQNKFKDYDFDGSNLSIILDILSYNTFKNNFYTNMVFSETFLDSAQMRNSVISHAKELNYLPRSQISSKAIVNVVITDDQETSSLITLPRYTKFTARGNGRTHGFITDKQYIARKNTDGKFYVNNIEIFEGRLIKEKFVQENISNDKFVLSNRNIDTRSIKVSSTLNDEEIIYSPKYDIFGVESNDYIYYIEAEMDERYSINFGNNKFGRNPEVNEVINVEYRISSGIEGNSYREFTLAGSNAIVKTVTQAMGGADMESIEDIKNFSPRSIQVQERAVTKQDYENLLKQRFPEIQSISVFGGDELEPPRFGRVAISVNTYDTFGLSDSNIVKFQSYLKGKTPLGIEPIFLNPEFTYVLLDIDVEFNTNTSTFNADELENSLRKVIAEYNENTLNKFGASLRSSKLLSKLEALDVSIESLEMTLTPYVEYTPLLKQRENPTFAFGDELLVPYPFSLSRGLSNYKPSVTSSVFYYKNTPSFLIDDGKGNLLVITSDVSNPQMLNTNAGSVDYNKGVVRLVNFVVTGYDDPFIQIKANTKGSDIVAPKHRILAIKENDININVMEVT